MLAVATEARELVATEAVATGARELVRDRLAALQFPFGDHAAQVRWCSRGLAAGMLERRRGPQRPVSRPRLDLLDPWPPVNAHRKGDLMNDVEQRRIEIVARLFARAASRDLRPSFSQRRAGGQWVGTVRDSRGVLVVRDLELPELADYIDEVFP